MLCYRDMTFCSADCATKNCPRQFTDKERERSKLWWGDGPGEVPVAFSDFSEHCEMYQPISDPSSSPSPRRA